MKQSQASRDRCLENVRRLHADYAPLKEQIDKMRDSLGLDKLPGIPDEDKLKKEYVYCQPLVSLSLHLPINVRMWYNLCMFSLL